MIEDVPKRKPLPLRRDPVKPTRIGKRPGPKPTFTLGDAIEAALSMGLDRFTMGNVARRLNVAPSALYRVVADRDSLVRESLSYLAAHHRAPSEDLRWEDQLRRYAAGMWQVFEDNPGLAGIMVNTPLAERAMADFIDRMLGNLTSAGMEPNDAAFAIDFIGDTVLITHIGVTARRAAPTPDKEVSPAAAEAWEKLPTDLFGPAAAGYARYLMDRKVEFIIGGFGGSTQPVAPPTPEPVEKTDLGLADTAG